VSANTHRSLTLKSSKIFGKNEVFYRTKKFQKFSGILPIKKFKKNWSIDTNSGGWDSCAYSNKNKLIYSWIPVIIEGKAQILWLAT
jgi:hypothetical protein